MLNLLVGLNFDMTTTGELLKSTGGLLVVLALIVVTLFFRYFSFRTEQQLIKVGAREKAVSGRQALFSAGLIVFGAGTGMVGEAVATTWESGWNSNLFGLPIALSGIAAMGASYVIKQREAKDNDGETDPEQTS